MAKLSSILATDLDGTFLGGETRSRWTFYHELQADRDRRLLIFVTGRGVNSIQKLCQKPGIPEPDYIIGDVGTTIVHWPTKTPVSLVQNWIDDTWNGAGDRIKALLANEPGIKLQPIDPDRRVSYYYQPELLEISTLQKIVDAGYDYIMSGDRYLDVMPKGVSKGPSLLKLIEALDLDREAVIAAGDSLNDLSLFATGLKSIAVGNSEPKLIEEIQVLPNVYLSTKMGVAGIVDGLNYYRNAKK
jgi:HAD superfamily hydrolase (TIGR01484 family)